MSFYNNSKAELELQIKQLPFIAKGGRGIPIHLLITGHFSSLLCKSMCFFFFLHFSFLFLFFFFFMFYFRVTFFCFLFLFFFLFFLFIFLLPIYIFHFFLNFIRFLLFFSYYFFSNFFLSCLFSNFFSSYFSITKELKQNGSCTVDYCSRTNKTLCTGYLIHCFTPT